MKKFFAFLFVLMFLFGLTACGNAYKGPLSCVSHIGTDGQVIAMIDYTENVHEEILLAMNNGQWVDDVTNCAYEYEFKVDNALIYYHSECGTFIDITSKRAMTLSDEQRVKINALLGVDE